MSIAADMRRRSSCLSGSNPAILPKAAITTCEFYWPDLQLNLGQDLRQALERLEINLQHFVQAAADERGEFLQAIMIQHGAVNILAAHKFILGTNFEDKRR